LQKAPPQLPSCGEFTHFSGDLTPGTYKSVHKQIGISGRVFKRVPSGGRSGFFRRYAASKATAISPSPEVREALNGAASNRIGLGIPD
jgi:hypothetical protein